jgi:hypothetical protein
MKRFANLLATLAFAVVAPFAAASSDLADAPQPKIGGAEVIYLDADNSGINSKTSSPAFWYAGTSGVGSY